MNKFILLSVGAICLSLAQASAEPDFGTIPDSFTGNWSGTYISGKKSTPLHATVIEYKNGYEVTFRAKPDPREEAIVIFLGRKEGKTLVLEPAAGHGQCPSS